LIPVVMAAAPLIAQAAQGLATQVANSVAGIFGSNDNTASGQNVPSSGASSSAPSTPSASASALSNSVTSQLLQLQDSSTSGKAHHHHHHGAGSYKASSDLASSLTDPTSASIGAAAPITAVTA